MKKWFISAILFLLYLVSPVLAADIDVICNDSGCTMSPYSGATLFYEDDIKPSWNLNRDFSVTNNGAEECFLYMGTTNENDPDNLALVLFTAINDGAQNWFGEKEGLGGANSNKNFYDLFNSGDVNLGIVLPGQTVNFLWTVTMDPDAGNAYQDKTMTFDFDLVFSCGEPSQDLTIAKSNNRTGDSLKVDDIVTYTITLVNTSDSAIGNVQVKDIAPTADYFDYLENTGYLSCDLAGPVGEIDATGGNPYYWQIGTMDGGETCILTYDLKVLSTAIPGTHTNYAQATGTDSAGASLATGLVSSNITVGRSISLSASYAGQVLGATVKKVGEVLGAATGSKTFWLALAVLFIILGIIIKKNKKTNRLPIIFLAFGLLSCLAPFSVLAADTEAPMVSIVQLPEYTNQSSFDISYTALDADSGLQSVAVEFHKEGDSWQSLGSFSEASKKINVDSAKINEDKKFYFKATACDMVGNCAISETTIIVDRSGPPKPENYSKEKTGVQSYKIRWHNPDSDDLYKVYIYRSDKQDYDANDSTKISEVSVSKNSDSEYVDSVVPDSTKDWYYGIRSVDKAGNGSDLVGDTYSITSETIEYVSGSPVPSGQLANQQWPTSGAGGTTGGTGGEILGEETATPSASVEVVDYSEASQSPTPTASTSVKKIWPYLVIFCGFVVMGASIIFKKKNSSS